MSQLQVYCTVDKKHGSEFGKNLCSTYCPPTFFEYPVQISRLPDAKLPRYSGPKSNLECLMFSVKECFKIKAKTHVTHESITLGEIYVSRQIN